MLLDFSKTALDARALTLLIELAEARGVPERRDLMFTGAKINTTEDRAVLHMALRNRSGKPILVDGKDVMPEVDGVLDRMAAFSDGVRSGAIAATDGGKFTDVVNIGIGGSDLGPAMATLALAPYHDGPRAHFVSNVDGAHIHDTLAPLDPQRTLVIVASKTFTTIETMTNARTAQAWMQATLGRVRRQPLRRGLDGARQDLGLRHRPRPGLRLLGLGRRPLLGLGRGRPAGDDRGRPEALRRVPDRRARDGPALPDRAAAAEHAGAARARRHLAPQRHGLSRRARSCPTTSGCCGCRPTCSSSTWSSNGKRVTLDGSPVATATGPVVWGEPGTNGQHAFYQLIHQGTDVVPCEFLVAAVGHEPALDHQHEILLANCLAQSEALMRGRTLAEAEATVNGPGAGAAQGLPRQPAVDDADLPELDPRTLGRIIALYEHRVFVEGVIWGINSFDQWGVELGKELATALLPLVQSGRGFEGKDGSTAGLLEAITELRR